MATTDNHDGIRLEQANAAWVHNNNIHGVTGDSQNSAGIKLYATLNTLISDNYIHGNTVGIFDKDSSAGVCNNTYARNWITANSRDQFLGNNNPSIALYYFYDNVVDGDVSLSCNDVIGVDPARNNQVYNNLFLSPGGSLSNETTTGGLDSVWNNVVIGGGGSISGYNQ